MKIITWNCQGAFRKKAGVIAKYAPDIAVIQECEEPGKLHFVEETWRPKNLVWFGDRGSKGISILSYTNAKFELYKGYDSSIRHCIPVRVTGCGKLNLIAVWAMNDNSKRLSYIGQVVRAIEAYKDFLSGGNTFVMGDFNSNTQWDSARPSGNHTTVVESLAQHRILSAYHAWFEEKQGEETRPTLYMQRKRRRSFHVDYCFVPEKWYKRMTALLVGSYKDWRNWSDHSPIVAEFANGGKTQSKKRG